MWLRITPEHALQASFIIYIVIKKEFSIILLPSSHNTEGSGSITLCNKLPLLRETQVVQISPNEAYTTVAASPEEVFHDHMLSHPSGSQW
jgi:hypothetical protein